MHAGQAITFNYIVCVITGCIALGEVPVHAEMIYEPWVPLIVLLGLCFIVGFNIASQTVRHFGMAIATVAQRMSLGISVTFSILYYNDTYTIYRVLGVLLALSAVVFINIPAKKTADNTEVPKVGWLILYPIAIFLISGIIEIILQYLHSVHFMKPAVESIILFGNAAVLGILVLLYQVLFKKAKVTLKNMVAGVILGIPNYFSIYFLLRAFDTLDGSVVHALNNTLIVAGAALVGMIGFKERLSPINLVGIVAAVCSILLLTL